MKNLKTPTFINILLGMAGGMYYRQLKRASKNPRKSQEKTLRGILTLAKDTVYGREHDFAYILGAENDTELYKRYQEKVQIGDYEDFRPYVERHKNGESDVLFPGKPALYTTTSGSTSQPKWIPIFPEYLDNRYGRMTKVWLNNFIQNRPLVFGGKVFSVIGKTVEGYAPDGTVLGSISGYTQGNCPDFLKVIYANPPCVSGISDFEARYYVLMRRGIEQNVSLIIAANPSSIVELQNNVNKYFDDYVADIENGTIKADLKIEPEIRAELEAMQKPIVDAVHEAEKNTGIKTRFFIGFADLSIKGYEFYYEFENQDITQEQAEHFTEEVDRVLQEINIEYKAKRVSLRLKIPETYRLIPDSLEAFRAQCNAEGSRDEQFKLNLLSENEKRQGKFKKLVIEE